MKPEPDCTPGSDHLQEVAGFTAACLTVSDRSAAGEREDRSGPRLVTLVEALGGEVTARRVVPDELDTIRSALEEWLGAEPPPRFIITSGGTGPAPRDVTPEATAPLLQRRLPGVEDALRRSGLPAIPTAALGRGLVGITGSTLVVNLPGSPGAVDDALEVLRPLVGHILKLIGPRGVDD